MAKAQIEVVKLGSSQEEVTSLLGTPLEKTVKNDLEIYTYSSLTGTLADYIYFKNKAVILISRSYFGQEVKQQQVFSDLGVPEKSYLYTVGDRGTESSQRFLSWYSKGIAVQLEGNASSNVLERTLVFTPMSEQDFFTLWSPSRHLTEQQVIFTETERKDGVPNQNQAQSEMDILSTEQRTVTDQGVFSPRVLLPIGGGIVVGLLVLGILFWLIRRNLGSKNNIPEQVQ